MTNENNTEQIFLLAENNDRTEIYQACTHRAETESRKAAAVRSGLIKGPLKEIPEELVTILQNLKKMDAWSMLDTGLKKNSLNVFLFDETMENVILLKEKDEFLMPVKKLVTGSGSPLPADYIKNWIESELNPGTIIEARWLESNALDPDENVCQIYAARITECGPLPDKAAWYSLRHVADLAETKPETLYAGPALYKMITKAANRMRIINKDVCL